MKGSIPIPMTRMPGEVDENTVDFSGIPTVWVPYHELFPLGSTLDKKGEGGHRVSVHKNTGKPKRRAPFGSTLSHKQRRRRHEPCMNRKRVMKLAILARQDWKCVWCGDPLEYETATFEHAVPFWMGGDFSLVNLAVSCNWCNKVRKRSPCAPRAKRPGDRVRSKGKREAPIDPA